MDAIKAYAQNEGRKTESKWRITCYRNEGNGFLYSIVTDGESWLHHVKPEMKNPLYILTYKEKISRQKLLLVNACSPFSGIQRHHPLVVLGQRYENQLQDLLEDPKEVETINQSCLSETKHGNTRPDTNVASSVAVESRFKIVPHPPYSPVGTILILVVRSSQETSQSNSFHM